jgi:glycosyltransferase involved in cell wall biosynthesis
MKILMINSAAIGTGIGNIMNLLLKFGTLRYDVLNVDIFGTLKNRTFVNSPNGETLPLITSKNIITGVSTILNRNLSRKICSLIRSRNVRYDIFLLSTTFLQFLANDLKTEFNIPVVTILHDLGKVSIFSPKSFLVKAYSIWNARKIPSANLIITNSEYTRENLESFLKRRLEGVQIKVVELAIDCTSFQHYDKKVARQYIGIPLDKRIILSIGHDYPPKNISSLFRAFDLIKDPNVLLLRVGRLMHSKRTYDKLTYSTKKRIIVMRDVGNDLIPLIYASADLLVYPSLFEGFGLEIIESAIMGTPLLFSNIKPMNLIIKGITMIDEPDNAAEIYEKIEKYFLGILQLSIDSETRSTLTNTYCHNRYVRDMEMALSDVKIAP